MTVGTIAVRMAKHAVRASFLFGALLGFVLSSNAVRATPNVTNATTDANWILGAVISGGTMNGALANYPGSNPTYIAPYQANYACLGLCRVTQITGNMNYVDAVWNYLSWYAGHMDVDGYVHDWSYTNGAWVQGSYDSTDSYAATFLLAARAAYTVDPEIAKLQNINWGVQVAINAIYTTQQSNGMTYSKPGWPVEYLEDNSEAYQGQIAGSQLAADLGLTSLSTTAANRAALMLSGIGTLWSSANNDYYWADNSGSFTAVNWANLSPDTMEEGWAVSYDIATSSQATSIMNDINTYQPDWDQPADFDDYDQTVIGWGYYNQGHESAAQAQAASIRTAAVAANEAWPFTPMDCGALIILETDGESLIF